MAPKETGKGTSFGIRKKKKNDSQTGSAHTGSGNSHRLLTPCPDLAVPASDSGSEGLAERVVKAGTGRGPW